MLTLIKQELYKLLHKNGTYIGLACIFCFQIALAILSKVFPGFMSADAAFGTGFAGSSITVFVMIAATASIIAMEFQYGTVRQLLYRKYYRSQVFISKIIVVILHALVLYVLQFVMALLLKFALFPSIDLGASAGHGRTVLSALAISNVADFISLLLLLSVVLLLSTLFKSNAAAITSGYIGYFVMSMASSLLMLLISHWEWVKWNPFTMMLLGNQILNPAMSSVTHLSTPIMFWGSIAYTVVFSFLAYALFRKRSV